MRKILLVLAIAILALAIAPSASAWYSATHTWICDQAGFSSQDCNQADDDAYQSKHPELKNSRHFCINNTDDCAARTIAKKWFAINSNVSLHLWADSMTPVHWKRFDNIDCHDVFEDCVETNIRLGNTEWTCELECVVPATGQRIINKADHNYMVEVADYVRGQYNHEKKKHMIISWALFALLLIGLAYIIRSARSSH